MTGWRSGDGDVSCPDERGRARGRGQSPDDVDLAEGRVDLRDEPGEVRSAGHSVLLPLVVGAVFLIVLVLGAMAG